MKTFEEIKNEIKIIGKEFFSMKKLICILIIFSFLSSFAFSDKLNWKIGDYWKYEATDLFMGKERKYIEEMRVIEKENVSFYGKRYFTYKVEIRRLNETLLSFYRVNDLADIGSSYDNYSVISEPPLEKYKFLEAGKKWNQTIKWIQNVEGKIHNISFVVYYECLGKEKVRTSAGNFECYKIKSYSNSSNYGIDYFSPSIKNKVLSISYKNGEIVSKKELIETSYRKNYEISSFTFSMLISSFICILLLMKKRKGEKA